MNQITDNLITDEGLDEVSGGCNVPCYMVDPGVNCVD
jgi:hypothetical protein